MSVQLVIDTPEDMAAFGALLACRLAAGDLVTLNGELGAGKTTLTRGLGEALQVRGAVTSPTFVLARTHPRAAGAPLVHVDAYRLSSAVELDDLDIDFERSIVVVEWGAGLLDGITETWLSIDIARPTGAGSNGADDRAGEGRLPGGAADAASDDPDELPEPVEPRTLTVTGHGERWKDLGWVGAPRH
jgi:tRNA threonylcarbamoyladenosine biosynthesis protein TsaE